MYKVLSYEAVRRAVFVEGLSRREAAKRFGKDPRTIAKMCAFSAPPGYRRAKPPVRPKLGTHPAAAAEFPVSSSAVPLNN